MTEQDYITVEEIGLIKAALGVLRKITPENSKIIPVSGLQDIYKTLTLWQVKLLKEIKIKHS